MITIPSKYYINVVDLMYNRPRPRNRVLKGENETLPIILINCGEDEGYI